MSWPNNVDESSLALLRLMVWKDIHEYMEPNTILCSILCGRNGYTIYGSGKEIRWCLFHKCLRKKVSHFYFSITSTKVELKLKLLPVLESVAALPYHLQQPIQAQVVVLN